MGGKANPVKAVKSAFSNPIRGLTAIGTFGTSELARRIPGPIGQVARLPETASDTLLGTRYGNNGAADLQGFNGAQDPATLLAQTGGAPVLANVAMGVDPQEALAGYFGKSTKDGSWEEFLGTLNQKDLDAVNSVHGQLTTISKNRDLRQQAVDKTINDFPNIVAQNRQQYGAMFDSDMKQYVDQALNSRAAQLSANGQLNSGAANEAYAKVGADNALNRLSYSTDNAVRDAGLRLNEVNALRDFQNTMLTGQVGQGFSAQQANLQRQFQGQQFNAEQANQRYLSDQQSKNAMLGSIFGLGGSVIGAGILSNSLGAAAKVTTPSPFGSGGYGGGPGIDTSGNAPGSLYRGY